MVGRHDKILCSNLKDHNTPLVHREMFAVI